MKAIRPHFEWPARSLSIAAAVTLDRSPAKEGGSRITEKMRSHFLIQPYTLRKKVASPKNNPDEIRAINRLGSFKSRMLAGSSLVVIAAAACALFSPIVYAGGKDKSDKTGSVASAKQEKLTGQQLYAINCNRCHSERYPTEWTAAHWRTVLTHMRVRANLPAEQAKEILKYLEQDAGN
jgi:hypothetical protein